jgi:translation initiation factor 6 (eIF-6)
MQMGGMSNDHKVDKITSILLKSIQHHYHNILNQYNMQINDMNQQQLEERLTALNREILNTAHTEAIAKQLEQEKHEVIDRIKWLNGGDE